MKDLIERQAAIDVLHMDTSIIPYEKAREYADATILEIRNRLEKLSSAQPEPCADAVSREYLTEHIEACWMNGRMSTPDLNEVLSWINDVPSAQPEVAKDTNVPINDCINRQAAISAITGHSGVVDKSVAKRILTQMPSAQPKIIRCQDCKHFIELLDEKSAKKYGQEYACEYDRLNKPEPDDFCSRPKRKENR